MPLVAMLDGERVDATKHTRESWAELQSSDDRKQMVMPLCGIRAVAKTRGETRFFAHLTVADCRVEHGGETPQHQAVKTALRDRIDAIQGWHACLEYPHPSREWIIDVLAESDDGARRIAFEVQLSSQAPLGYQARSQRYFNDRVFPVWIVPRQLEHNGIEVPVVVTGFGKSSQLPEDPAELLQLPAISSFSSENTLGKFVDAILTYPPRWPQGSPEDQLAAIRRAQEREQRARQEAELKQRHLEERIAEMNLNSASPEAAYGAHTVHTDGGPFVWATLTQCWSCEHPMMLWEAQAGDDGVQHTAAPRLKVKTDIRSKRYENHPDVHQALNRWIGETRADVGKAYLKMRRSKTKGAEYSAFVCPACDALMGQMFVSCIGTEKWSLVSAPLLKKTRTTEPSAKPRPVDAWRGKPQKQRPPNEPAVQTLYRRPTVPEELQTDRKKTWAELHSPEGVAEARQKFMGTRGFRAGTL
ncbi:competence protein CoiA family protein [Arthrobacter sp. YAF16]|uniref:competence protein CoiA family protein n=1 Tax=Arthrobacter sp. YAF16 TaxID=3233076 RepID=UPI003F92782B